MELHELDQECRKLQRVICFMISNEDDENPTHDDCITALYRAKEAMEKVIETAEKMASTVDHISSFDRNEMCKLISEVQGEGGSEKDMIEAIHGFSGEVLTPAQLRLLGLGTTI